MADYGMKVSEEGHDVFTAQDKNLSLKSGFTLLKVFDSGILTLSSGWNEVDHNLGYVPHFLVYTKDTTPSPDAIFLATGDLGIAIARADTSKLYIKQDDASQTEAYYYIFYEPTDTGTAPAVVSTSDFGIKISKDGFDVKTANILQQTFNSEKNTLKIVTDGEDSSTANGSRTLTIAHGLSVTPAYFVFYEVNNDGNWFSNFTESHLSGAIVEARTNDTNLIIDITTTSSQTVKVKYYILADPGN